MEIKQPFFVDPNQPGYVRGGPFDEMGGMLVGMHSVEVCNMLNEHLALKEMNGAMESVLQKIGVHFGVDPGDVDGLFAAIEDYTSTAESGHGQ